MKPPASHGRRLVPKKLPSSSSASSPCLKIEGSDSPAATWTEQDEINLLNSMIYLKTVKPLSTFQPLHSYLLKHNGLSFPCTMKQLTSKIGKLRDRFRDNFLYGDFIFSDPHKEALFILSKKLWENEVKHKEEQADREDQYCTLTATSMRDLFDKNSHALGFTSFANNLEVSKGHNLIKFSDRLRLKEAWDKLSIDESNITARRLELLGKHASLATEAYAKSVNTRCNLFLELSKK